MIHISNAIKRAHDGGLFTSNVHGITAVWSSSRLQRGGKGYKTDSVPWVMPQNSPLLTMSQPYFESVKSFKDVPITEDGIETQSFLEASDGLVKLFDLLGSGVFGFVQADIRGNIQGVRSRYQNASTSSITLENLIRSETLEANRHATGCLIRLTRGLLFLCRALQRMQDDTAVELHVCFKRSYDEVLSHHHTFIVRSLSAVAVRAVPYRRDFITRISQGGDREKFDGELRRWLGGLDVIVGRLKAFIEGEGYGRV